MAGERYMTKDHDTIRAWAEERGGRPATVASTHDDDDAGVLRLDFPGYSGGSLEEISWADWFQKFDESDLVLLYQETRASGEQSSFNKLISSNTAQASDDASWVGGSSGSARSSRGSSGGREARRERRSGSRARKS